SVPWLGGATVKTTASPSGSLPPRGTATGVSCGVLTELPVAAGARVSCQRTAWVSAVPEADSPATWPTVLMATAAPVLLPLSPDKGCMPPTASQTKAVTVPVDVTTCPTT